MENKDLENNKETEKSKYSEKIFEGTDQYSKKMSDALKKDIDGIFSDISEEEKRKSIEENEKRIKEIEICNEQLNENQRKEVEILKMKNNKDPRKNKYLENIFGMPDQYSKIAFLQQGFDSMSYNNLKDVEKRQKSIEENKKRIEELRSNQEKGELNKIQKKEIEILKIKNGLFKHRYQDKNFD